MPQIPFVGGAYTGRSPVENAQELINFFVETQTGPEGGKVPQFLYGTPGLRKFASVGESVEIRGLHAMGDLLYVVAGDKIKTVDALGTVATIGSVLTSSGPVTMDDNFYQVCIVDGANGYLASAGGSQRITAEGFPGGTTVVCQDNYFIVNRPGTADFFISGANDGTSWYALDFASADGIADIVVGLINDHRELWIFGTESTEIFYNSGDPLFPFTRNQGAFIEQGCSAPYSIAKADNAVFWLGENSEGGGRVFRAQGYLPKVISTRELEYQISTYSRNDNAIGYSLVLEGHEFYMLTFPSANITWAYDLSNGIWSKWLSYPNQGRHRGQVHCYFSGKHILGDFENGVLYELDTAYYTDNGNPIIRERTCQVIHQERHRIRHTRLEIEFEQGTGNSTGLGVNPQAMLQWSDDGGRTWSNETWADIGALVQGQYSMRAVWRRLGQSRNRNYRLVVSDPIKWIILGAFLEVEGGTI